MNWHITDKIQWQLSNTLYPSTTHGGEYRNVTTTKISVDMAEILADGIFWEFRLNNEYVSNPQDRDTHNHLHFMSSFKYRF